MMLAIVRKSLASLLSNHNSSPHFFSTLRDTQNAISPKVYDLLFLKHHFPPELASQVASNSNIGRPRSSENADSILSFLKESGCSSTQLQKIVKYNPRILWHSVEYIKLKIKIFKDLGLSPKDTAKMMSSNPVILQLSIKSNIIPSLSVLKGLLGSDYDVARLLRKSSWPVSSNLEDTLVPNVEFLKSIGIPMDHILSILYLHPRFLLMKPPIIRKSADKTKEMGLSETSKMFLYVVRVVASMTKEAWEAKLQSFQDMGFSQTDILIMFKNYPQIYATSIKKIDKIYQLLLATGKFNLSSIVKYPILFGHSIEQRLEPRLRILGILESKNLIKWPGLGQMCQMPDDKFFDRYVRPYSNEVGQVFVTKSCAKDKN